MIEDKEELLPLCGCGCGLRVSKLGNRFIHGHHMRGVILSDKTRKKMSENHADVSGENNPNFGISRFGEDSPFFGKKHTQESIEKMSNAQTGNKNSFFGKKHTQESIEKIRESNKGINKGENNGMYGIRGGDDIVKHHYIYDHAHPELYTMKVTRKKHGQIHAWMRKAGIVVPHINEDVISW